MNIILNEMGETDALREFLKRELNNLPGEEAHQEMIPFRLLSSQALKTALDYKTSAVLALIYPEDGVHHLVLTQRQDYGGKHSGQISFPGGKMEPLDKSVVETALRETSEEIGIPSESVEILGQLTDVYIPVSGFLVHPFVGFVSAKPNFVLEEREVRSVITFPIQDLLNDQIRIKTKIQNHQGQWMKDIPCFEIEKKAVWGATALMLNEIRFILKRF